MNPTVIHTGPQVIQRNAQFRAATSLSPALPSGAVPGDDTRGTVTNSVTSFFADISSGNGTGSPGGNISITVKFDARIASIPAGAFNIFRSELCSIVGEPLVAGIDQDAGIPEGAQDGSGMERFAIGLFSRMFSGDFSGTQNFDAGQCLLPCRNCAQVLQLIASLEPRLLHFSGELHVEGPPNIPQRMTASIPVTAVNFASGYTVPFTGYAGPIVCEGIATASPPAGKAVSPANAHAVTPVRLLLAANSLTACLIDP